MQNTEMKNAKEEWRFQLEGLSCAACAAAVKRALQTFSEISEIEINPLTQKIRLELSPNSILQVDTVVAAVQKAGFGAVLTEKRRIAADGVVIEVVAGEKGEQSNVEIACAVSHNFCCPSRA